MSAAVVFPPLLAAQDWAASLRFKSTCSEHYDENACRGNSRDCDPDAEFKRMGTSLNRSLSGMPSWLLRDNKSANELQPAGKHDKTLELLQMERLALIWLLQRLSVRPQISANFSFLPSRCAFVFLKNGMERYTRKQANMTYRVSLDKTSPLM